MHTFLKRLLKILLLTIVSLLLLAGIGAFIMRNYLQEIIMHRLQSEIEATFGNYYHLDYAEIKTSIDNNTFTIKIVKPFFSTDTLQHDFVAKYPVVFFKADSIEVGGINIQKLFISQSIELKTIALNNPNLVFLLQKPPKKDTAAQKEKVKNPRKLIDEIVLKNLSIEKGNVNILHLSNASDTLYYGEHINISITNARIPTQAAEGIYAASKVDNIFFSMSNVRFYPEKSPYSFFMGDLKFDAKLNTLSCRKVSLYPEKSLLRMSKNSKYQKTFASIQIGNIFLRGIDYHKIGEPALNVKYAEIANSHFSLLRNKNVKLNKAQYKKSIQEALFSIKLPLKIDTLNLKNIHLSIDIYFPKQTNPATIKLHHINGTVLHIDNNKYNKKPMLLHAKATIMQTGKLVFDASFPVHKQTHTYKADITNMPFAEWNQVISRLANVQLSSGNIKHIQLNGSATSMETSGNILFEYRDLQASVYKQDKNGKLKKAKALSYITNRFLRLHNPDVGETKPVSKDYYFKREPYQGPIMLWIGGLLDGIEATLLNERLKKKVDQVEAQKVKTRKK